MEAAAEGQEPGSDLRPRGFLSVCRAQAGAVATNLGIERGGREEDVPERQEGVESQGRVENRARCLQVQSSSGVQMKMHEHGSFNGSRPSHSLRSIQIPADGDDSI